MGNNVRFSSNYDPKPIIIVEYENQAKCVLVNVQCKLLLKKDAKKAKERKKLMGKQTICTKNCEGKYEMKKKTSIISAFALSHKQTVTQCHRREKILLQYFASNKIVFLRFFLISRYFRRRREKKPRRCSNQTQAHAIDCEEFLWWTRNHKNM